MLHTENRTKERILLIGPPGAGKSTAWLKIAQLAQTTQSPAQFWVGDTDLAVTRMLESEYPSLANVRLHTLFDWPDYMRFVDTVRQQSQPDDWVIIDLLDPAWEAVQSYYIQQVFGEDIDSFFLEHRKNMKKGEGALDGWKDWGVINKMYKAFSNKLFFGIDRHILATAKVEKVSEQDTKEVRSIYGPYGVKPKGQKETSHAFHTVMLLTFAKPGEWYINTIKDRGRAPYSGTLINNFALDYLIKVAGWKMM